MRPGRRVLVHVLVAFTLRICSAQDGFSEEQREVASMMESHLSMLASIESFDVLIEGSSLIMIGGTPSHEIVTRVRWIRCTKNDRHLYIRTAELHRLADDDGSVQLKGFKTALQ